jgi:hypothetical protein
MSDFARLEKHYDVQVLSFIEARDGDNGKYGPCLITRCDPSISITYIEGPWPDDEDGWDAAEKALAEKDLEEFVKNAPDFVSSLLPEQSNDPSEAT